jgi:hypothetical protein
MRLRVRLITEDHLPRTGFSPRDVLAPLAIDRLRSFGPAVTTPVGSSSDPRAEAPDTPQAQPYT